MIYDDKKFIGQVIKSARKNAKLSQEALCEKLGMTDKNLGNIENGRQFPQVNNFLKIIEVLNLNLNDFGVRIQAPDENKKNEILKMVLGADNKKLQSYYYALVMADKIMKNSK